MCHIHNQFGTQVPGREQRLVFLANEGAPLSRLLGLGMMSIDEHMALKESPELFAKHNTEARQKNATQETQKTQDLLKNIAQRAFDREVNEKKRSPEDALRAIKLWFHDIAEVRLVAFRLGADGKTLEVIPAPKEITEIPDANNTQTSLLEAQTKEAEKKYRDIAWSADVTPQQKLDAFSAMQAAREAELSHLKASLVTDLSHIPAEQRTMNTMREWRINEINIYHPSDEKNRDTLKKNIEIAARAERLEKAKAETVKTTAALWDAGFTMRTTTVTETVPARSRTHYEFFTGQSKPKPTSVEKQVTNTVKRNLEERREPKYREALMAHINASKAEIAIIAEKGLMEGGLSKEEQDRVALLQASLEKHEEDLKEIQSSLVLTQEEEDERALSPSDRRKRAGLQLLRKAMNDKTVNVNISDDESRVTIVGHKGKDWMELEFTGDKWQLTNVNSYRTEPAPDGLLNEGYKMINRITDMDSAGKVFIGSIDYSVVGTHKFITGYDFEKERNKSAVLCNQIAKGCLALNDLDFAAPKPTTASHLAVRPIPLDPPKPEVIDAQRQSALKGKTEALSATWNTERKKEDLSAQEKLWILDPLIAATEEELRLHQSASKQDDAVQERMKVLQRLLDQCMADRAGLMKFKCKESTDAAEKTHKEKPTPETWRVLVDNAMVERNVLLSFPSGSDYEVERLAVLKTLMDEGQTHEESATPQETAAITKEIMVARTASQKAEDRMRVLLTMFQPMDGRKVSFPAGVAAYYLAVKDDIVRAHDMEYRALLRQSPATRKATGNAERFSQLEKAIPQEIADREQQYALMLMDKSNTASKIVEQRRKNNPQMLPDALAHCVKTLQVEYENFQAKRHEPEERHQADLGRARLLLSIIKDMRKERQDLLQKALTSQGNGGA